LVERRRGHRERVDSGWLIGGRYRLGDRLGAGGMSVVWQARDELLDRDVAVKVLAPALAEDPELLRRIHAEARAAAGLRHPNVVAVYDYGETEDRGRTVPYIVMELVTGRSMNELLSGGPLPWRLAVLIGAQVAAALAAAHAHGIVHRDVKPANVMVTAAGVKLVDFGISATVGDADMAEGQLLGTPAYLAPERLDGGHVRPATDVYALGLLLYLGLAGRLPWEASTATQMLKAHRYREPPPLPDVPDLPQEAAELCHRCLAKRPDDRPTAANAAETLGTLAGLPPASLLLGAASDAVAEDSTTVDLPAATTTRPHAAARPRRTAVLAGGVAATVAAGGLFAWAALRPDPTHPAASAAPEPVRVACAVSYALRSAVNGRSANAVTIRNTGSQPVPAWRLSFTLPDEQRLLRGWTGQWQQSGRSILALGGALPAGGSVTTGFDAAYQGATSLPAAFVLNGTACTSVLSVQGRNSTPPAQSIRRPGNAAVAKAADDKAKAEAKDKGKGKKEGKGKEKDKGHGKD
jgi:eukaryotic-like serine/threonine-protein kinase